MPVVKHPKSPAVPSVAKASGKSVPSAGSPTPAAQLPLSLEMVPVPLYVEDRHRFLTHEEYLKQFGCLPESRAGGLIDLYQWAEGELPEIADNCRGVLLDIEDTLLSPTHVDEVTDTASELIAHLATEDFNVADAKLLAQRLKDELVQLGTVLISANKQVCRIGEQAVAYVEGIRDHNTDEQINVELQALATRWRKEDAPPEPKPKPVAKPKTKRKGTPT